MSRFCLFLGQMAWGICGLRQFLKGWGSNARGEYNHHKKFLMDKIKETDTAGQNGVGHDDAIRNRTCLEKELEQQKEAEELYWLQRGEKSGSWKGMQIQLSSI